jgi:hypothetical protein
VIISKIRSGDFEWSKEHVDNAALDLNRECRELNSYNAWGWFLIVVGFVWRLSGYLGVPLSTYPHEWFHGLAAVLTGGRVISIEAFHCSWTGANDMIAWAAGYWGELFVYGLLSLVFPWRKIGKLCAGIVAWLPIEATVSSDFEKIGGDVSSLYMLAWTVVVIVIIVRQVSSGEVHYPAMPSRLSDQPESSQPLTARTNR